MLNQVTLMGRMTRDPELKYTPSEKAVVSFTIAVDRDYKGEDAADFIDCVAWNKTADMVDRYFHKGERIIVSGRIQTRTWETNDGKKRKATEIVVDRAYFVETKSRGDVAHQPKPQSETFHDIDAQDGELPF